jgi:LPXTG-site transpeptidase (sortase) family protein
MLSRRGFLQATAGVAVTGAVASAVDLAPAGAAIPSVGSAAIVRIWGTKSARQRIPGSTRTRTVKVPKTKPIYEGTAKKILNTGGLCHWFGTPAPLENGNCVLFGHRTSAGGPLRNSHRMKVGDPITLTVAGQTLTYYVAEKPLVIASNDFHSVAGWGNPNKPCLTLVACTKSNGMPTSTKYRLLIRAQAL